MRYVRTGLLLAVLLCLALSGCSMLQGREKDGRYYSPDGEFSVAEPNIRSLEADDASRPNGTRTVQFTYAGIWIVDGAYALEWDTAAAWDNAVKAFASDEDFYASLTLQLPRGLNGMIAADFKLVQARRVTVNGRAAYQIVMRGMKDDKDSYLVGTAINFHNRVAMGALLTPVSRYGQQAGSSDPEKAVPWGQYNAFLDSIADYVPYP